MRNLAVGLLTGVLLASMPVQATQSRSVALGDMGLYIEDDTNVLRYPGLIGKHTHFFYLDLAGRSGLQPGLTGTQQGGLNGGAFVGLNENFSLGIVASDFSPDAPAAFFNQVAKLSPENRTVFQSLAPDAALRRYDLIFGYQANKDFGAGLRLSYGSDSDTFVPDKASKVTPADPATEADKIPFRRTDRKSQTQFQMTAGVSGALSDAASFDFAFDYGHFGFDYDKNEDYAFLASGSEIGVAARARVIVSRFWDVVPQVAYRGTFFDLKEDGIVPAFGAASSDEFKAFPNSGIRDHKRSVHTLDAGVAGVMRANEKVNFWAATGILHKSTNARMNAEMAILQGENLLDSEDITTLTSLPYVRFAVEGTPLSWLQLRVGVEKFTWRTSSETYRTVNVKQDENEKETTTTERTSASPSADAQADFSTYVGASFFLEGFRLDLLLDQEFFKRGPSFLSGSAGDIAGRASLSYRF